MSRVGAQVGQYRLVELVGHGATGRVFRARPSGAIPGRGRQDVAVKLLRGEFADDATIRARFLSEGRLLQGRRLPGAIRVLDVIDDGDHAAIVMELVEGGTLRQLIADHAPVRPQVAAPLILQVARAVSAAEMQGIIHGDIKPENVLLRQHDGVQEAVLSDFGLARVIEETMATQTTSQFLATPHYAAPEIHEGRLGGTAADVYALGLMLYELIAGRRPFESGTRLAEVRLHLTARPRRTGDFSDELWDLIESCLAKEPQHRPSAARMVTVLDVLISRGLVEPVDAMTLDRETFQRLSADAQRRRPHRRRYAVAAVAAVGLTGVAANQLRPGRGRGAVTAP